MDQDENLVRKEMLRQGVCLRCAAYFGRSPKEQTCHAMTPGCPAPDYMKQKVENKNNGEKKTR